MHRISYIEIQNFRAYQSVSLPLDDFTPLVGQNNVGKSTILESLRWLLKPDARSASDFADTKQPIVVTARIEGISAAILGRIPEPKHRTAIEPYCPNVAAQMAALVECFDWVKTFDKPQPKVTETTS